MIKKFKEFVNENKMIKEGSDWVLLQSGNVCVDTWSLCFIPLGSDGAPTLMDGDIQPDEPEYNDILNKLDDKDRESYEDIKKDTYQTNKLPD